MRGRYRSRGSSLPRSARDAERDMAIDDRVFAELAACPALLDAFRRSGPPRGG
jgi:hypothetical protein